MTVLNFDPQKEKYISLGTFRRDGREVRTAVWFAADENSDVYCFSAAGAGKVKRLRNSARSVIAVCNSTGKVSGQWQPCSAFIVSEDKTIHHAYTLLIEKYGWQMRLTNFLSFLSGRINHRAVIRITLDE